MKSSKGDRKRLIPKVGPCACCSAENVLTFNINGRFKCYTCSWLTISVFYNKDLTRRHTDAQLKLIRMKFCKKLVDSNNHWDAYLDLEWAFDLLLKGRDVYPPEWKLTHRLTQDGHEVECKDGTYIEFPLACYFIEGEL